MIAVFLPLNWKNGFSFVLNAIQVHKNCTNTSCQATDQPTSGNCCDEEKEEEEENTWRTHNKLQYFKNFVYAAELESNNLDWRRKW